MRKISLDVDALEVESFDTRESGAKERGTVHGRGFTRDWEPSCHVSCTRDYDCDCLSEMPSGCTIAPCRLIPRSRAGPSHRPRVLDRAAGTPPGVPAVRAPRRITPAPARPPSRPPLAPSSRARG